MRIVIEGTVGCGKTTLAKYLSEYTGIKLYEELINEDTNTLLNKFYNDLKRWSFPLQIHYLNERFNMIKNINKNNNGILDRSIYGDKIFAQMLNEDGNMTNEEYRTYISLLDNMLEHVTPPELIVYLKCSTKIAIDRLNGRNRGSEKNVPISYWTRLNEKYDEWYNNFDLSNKIIIDVDNFNIFDYNERNGIFKNILNEINK